MNTFKNMFFGLFFVIFAQGCSTLSTINTAVVDGVSSTVDTAVNGVATVGGAIINEAGDLVETGAELAVGVGQGVGDIAAGSLEVIAETVDSNTDAVQSNKEEKAEDEKK